MSKDIEIIPALMPKSFSELREQFERFVGLVETVQLDVMDGVFVPNKSWPYSENIEMLKELRGEMPSWEDINFEVDLMIQNPEHAVNDWLLLGASRVIVHTESTHKMDAIIAEVKDCVNGKQTDSEEETHVEVGIALNTTTENKMLEPWIGRVDFVQFMGIEKIGFQGQTFDERVIKKIQDLHEQYLDVTISVDGGVNFESAPKLIVAGATRLVSGSTILNSKDIAETINRLKNS
jgi:ribulose-phosphate 3-epimerase